MPRFRVWVSTDKAGSKCEHAVEIDNEELEEMSPADLEEFLPGCAMEMINWDHERLD